jgi:hypothetical protein
VSDSEKIAADFHRCPAAECLRQIVEGADFDTPHGLMRTISPAMSVAIAPGAPYSIATNVAHAQLWQGLWLCRLNGEPQPKVVPGRDFPVVTEGEWADLRRIFCDGLKEAHEIAQRDPFVHGAKSDAAAIQTLFKIANHGAYHLGQVKLLKRLLKASS